MAQRDTLTARATIAGLIDANDTSHWQQMSYDASGRVQTKRSPSPVLDERGRLAAQANVVVSAVAY